VPAGASCANGGLAIELGRDANLDGALETGEVGSTTYLCTPSSPAQQLAMVVVEPDGPNCANGGQAIEIGADTNGNGMLDASEVTSISYVCTGMNGMTALVRVDAEPPGASCADGG
jgi:hypothetical protein